MFRVASHCIANPMTVQILRGYTDGLAGQFCLPVLWCLPLEEGC